VTLDNFERALNGFTNRRRFLPFVVELVSGHRFRVTHPEAVSLRGELIVFFTPELRDSLFDGDSVCRLCDESAVQGIG
jgi:hypothetical protein